MEDLILGTGGFIFVATHILWPAIKEYESVKKFFKIVWISYAIAVILLLLGVLALKYVIGYPPHTTKFKKRRE
ncbi:MAG: hypothetical protein LBN01_01040 [Endomicrobium sp.]|jgi:hypothetical protein|nr:hypothetical protein [Endomicrobium sp.]